MIFCNHRGAAGAAYCNMVSTQRSLSRAKIRHICPFSPFSPATEGFSFKIIGRCRAVLQAVLLGCDIVVLIDRVSTTQSLKFCPLRCRVRSVLPTGTVPSGFGGVVARVTSCCTNTVTSVNVHCVSELIAVVKNMCSF